MNIKQIILNETINETKYIIVEGNNITYEITTTDNIKNDNYYNNKSKIDFSDCENKIKEKYYINYIIAQKADIYTNNNVLVIYELYNPNNKEELIDLSICEGDNIQIYKPIDITDEYIEKYNMVNEQGYNILDSNDTFYKDICSKFTSEYETDMSLSDRKLQYYNVNLTKCEIGCKYKNLYLDIKKLQCECQIRSELDFKRVNLFNKDDIIESFYKSEQYSNFKVIKCYKLVFSKEGQIYNYGSYFLTTIILFFFICEIIYFPKRNMLVANLIKKVLNSMNLQKSNPIKKNSKNNKTNKLLIKKSRKKNFLLSKPNKKEELIDSFNNITKKTFLPKNSKIKTKKDDSGNDIQIVNIKKKFINQKI